MNVVIEQLISQAYDLSVHWDNLVADRDSWKRLAEDYKVRLDQEIAAVVKATDMLYECQIDLGYARGEIHE